MKSPPGNAPILALFFATILIFGGFQHWILCFNNRCNINPKTDYDISLGINQNLAHKYTGSDRTYLVFLNITSITGSAQLRYFDWDVYATKNISLGPSTYKLVTNYIEILPVGDSNVEGTLEIIDLGPALDLEYVYVIFGWLPIFFISFALLLILIERWKKSKKYQDLPVYGVLLTINSFFGFVLTSPEGVLPGPAAFVTVMTMLGSNSSEVSLLFVMGIVLQISAIFLGVMAVATLSITGRITGSLPVRITKSAFLLSGTCSIAGSIIYLVAMIGSRWWYQSYSVNSAQLYSIVPLIVGGAFIMFGILRVRDAIGSPIRPPS